MKNKTFWEAVATMVGTIIGAGVLGLPYVVQQAGFYTGMLTVSIVGIMILILYLYLGEIILRTKGFHQLTGYCEKYLGIWGKRLMTFAMIFGTYGALTAYLIGEGKTLSAIFGVENSLAFSLIFFVVVSIIIYFGIKMVAESELYVLPVMILIILIISFFSLKYIDISNFTGFSVSNFFIPFGVALFAFLGAAAIPEMQQILVKNKKQLKKAILVGMSFPLIIYLLFAAVVVGVSGVSTTEIATIGLGNIIGPYMILLGNIFAVFAMATSFLTLGLALKQMYDFDYNISHNKSWLLTISVPLIILLSGFDSFIVILGLSGIIAGGIEGILIVLMFHKAKKTGDRKPEFEIKSHKILSVALILLFVLGAGFYFVQVV